MSTKKHNRLITEKSPYLLQHAENPVDWYPWGYEAFEKAKKENKPIFLSIGYSTCHWCHVMEKESFEDPAVAELMNDVFVSIKVDREERPDIDGIYMQVGQIMTGSGGWPLTIFMTAEKKPFFAGTYIPKNERFGRTGLLELIPKIKELWVSRREDLLASANQITLALKDQLESADPKSSKLDESTLKLGYNQLLRRFDSEHGGFGGAPKFPSPHQLLLLLRTWMRTGEPRALNMVEKTLQEMRSGGIYDHVGFGFHRYSTDAYWLVPHFEKMLYDQAMLAVAYLEAYQATGKSEYADTAREIFTYVLRDMTSDEGGFYSAEDADSEGVEGKFYIWTLDEVKEVLGVKNAELAESIFNLKKGGNFADQSGEGVEGGNILHLTGNAKELAKRLKITEQDLEKQIEQIRTKLYTHRDGRVHPHKDDKVLVDWNGLMIAALAKGYQVLAEDAYLVTAEKAAGFIIDRMRDADGRLLHRYRDGDAAIRAHVDDHAFFIWGLIELFEATFDQKYLDLAVELNDELMNHYWDPGAGGFYVSADDGEELLVRQKEIHDGAMPSGNSVAFSNLLRLSKLSGDTSLEKLASIQSKAFSGELGTTPSGYSMFTSGLDMALGPAFEVVIRGEQDAESTKEMLTALRTNYLPNIVVLLNPKKRSSGLNLKFKAVEPDKPGEEGEARAYVCVNYSCKEPTTSVERMLELLNTRKL